MPSGRGQGVWLPKRFFTVSGAAAVVLTWLLVGLTVRTAPEASMSLKALLPTGWRIEVEEGERFSGRFAPGDTLFVPPGARLVCAPCEGEAAAELFGESAFVAAGGFQTGRGSDGKEEVLYAPAKPGLYRLSARCGNENASLNLIVLHRADYTKDRHGQPVGQVGGVRLGTYGIAERSGSKKVRAHADDYQAPLWFAPITPETENLPLGQQFTVGDMVVGGENDGEPQGLKALPGGRHCLFFPPDRRIIEKLDALADYLRGKGYRFSRFTVTSFFRTPDYNRRTEGGSSLSRHTFGDAADIIIDADSDGKMDDLNGDGRQDFRDGLVIANACRELEKAGKVIPGGIGLYGYDGPHSVRSHVHLDCRGFPARWGFEWRKGRQHSWRWWPHGEFEDEYDRQYQ